MSADLTPKRKRHQDLRDLMSLPRSALASHYRRKVDELADVSNLPRLRAFLPQNAWPWIRNYAKYVFRQRHRFETYPVQGERGCYQMRSADASGSVRISVAGDWGTGTAEAERVADSMEGFDPHYTIHLGDVYYVGDEREINENCLGQPRGDHQGVLWPKGSLGSFTLNSNHEMYANGNGYFDVFIPTLGIPSSRDKKQLTSFFCLQNETWRILGLDTGYNSTGLPILAQIPLINAIPGVGPSCKLEPALLEWLRTTVDPLRNPRATVLLTHHQYFSAFEEGYIKPAQQLKEFFGNQDVLWLWGHEHRFAIYNRYTDAGMTVYGRCVGHGGMPVDITPPIPGYRAPLRYHDRRVYTEVEGTPIGFNGFVNIEIQAEYARLTYRDVTNRKIVVEKFEASGPRLSQTFEYVEPVLVQGAGSRT